MAVHKILNSQNNLQHKAQISKCINTLFQDILKAKIAETAKH